VVVANIQVRTLKAEVEKGFVRTAVDHESVDPKAQINLVNGDDRALSKGGSTSGRPNAERESGLIFLNPTSDIFTAT